MTSPHETIGVVLPPIRLIARNDAEDDGSFVERAASAACEHVVTFECVTSDHTLCFTDECSCVCHRTRYQIARQVNRAVHLCQGCCDGSGVNVLVRGADNARLLACFDDEHALADFVFDLIDRLFDERA